MRTKLFKKITSFVLAFMMIFGMMLPNSLAYAADATPVYEFGTEKTQLAPGVYDLPVSLNNASKPTKPSMAASCLLSGSLEVKNDGTGYVRLKLGNVSMGIISAWAESWMIYDSYDYANNSSKTSADVISTDAEGHQTEIGFKLPYTDQDGVFCSMSVPDMGMNPDAFIKMDFASLKKEETVQSANVKFSAGENGNVTATVDGAAIESGAAVELGKEVVFTAEPAKGYEVDSWTGLEASGTTANVTVDKDLDVKVTFKQEPAKETGNRVVGIWHGSKDQASMSDALFAETADYEISGDTAKLKVYVVSPIPSFAEVQGDEETISSAVISYAGQQYTAESDNTTKPTFQAKKGNPMFGLKKGQEVGAQILTFTLPAKALEEEYLFCNAHVASGMNSDVEFRFKFIHSQAETAAVNFTADQNGTLTATVDGKAIESGAAVELGKEVVFTAEAAKGYEVDQWTGVKASGTTATVKVEGDLNVGVTFKEVKKPLEVKKGQSEVKFGADKAYDVTADVSIDDGKIAEVVFGHNAAESDHETSVSYAENAKAMAEHFKGLGITDKTAIEGVDGVSGATITSDAYRNAVLKALDLYKPADFTFGSKNTKLEPGIYAVPIALRHAVHHANPSAAAGAFPATAILTVKEDGTAILTSDMRAVTIGPITDMAYDVKYYLGNSTDTVASDATVIGTTVKPEPMPGAGNIVPTQIVFPIPSNDWDGVYMKFTVDAMGPASPDAWLEIDYANAKIPGSVEHFKGSAKVNQFGKYTIYTDVSVKDGEIIGVDVTAGDFVSETHKPTNEMKIAQVTEALKDQWNHMAPTQENAEAIYKKIMKPEDPDSVIDSVSGATYSANAVRDAVMDAFDLQYQAENITVPENVEPGIYEVEIEYSSDVVWHSLVETRTAKAKLTVNEDKTMYLDIDTKSGTEKEPLYILGFNGVYPNNDRSQELTKEGCDFTKSLTPNDYADAYFEKGTQTVDHVRFPLLGGLQKEYVTNAYLYVPAMNKLNGNLSGVVFENGKFNVDVFAKIYWDGMEKVGELKPEVPDPEVPGTEEKSGTVDVIMLHETKNQPSMCDSLFGTKADVKINGETAELKVYVAYPIPAFPNEGLDGTIKNAVIHYNGKDYVATSDLDTKPVFKAKTDNVLFGMKAGTEVEAQVLTFTLPTKALTEAMLPATAFVNPVMHSDVKFRMQFSNMQPEDLLTKNPDTPEPNPQPENPEPNPQPGNPDPSPQPGNPEPNPGTVLDYRNLEDGVYIIQGSMVKPDKKSKSMADDAFNHNIKLTVKGGKYYLSLDFNGIELSGKQGYLGQIKYFLSGYGVNQYGEPTGQTANVTVDAYQTNDNGQKISDQYGTDYPDKITFEMIPEAFEDGLVPLQVMVPVMESIAPGMGNQLVYLKLSWDTVEPTDNNNPKFEGGNGIKTSSANTAGSGISMTKPGLKPSVKTGDVAQNNILWAVVLLLGCVMGFAGFTEYRRRKEIS